MTWMVRLVNGWCPFAEALIYMRRCRLKVATYNSDERISCMNKCLVPGVAIGSLALFDG